MELLQAQGEAFVVAGQALVADAPTQAALDLPTPGQQHEAALGVAEFDDLQVDARGLHRLRRGFARVALAGVGQRNALARCYLHFLGQHAHLGAVLLVG